MNPPSAPPSEAQVRRNVNRLVEEIARLSESALAPGEFCAEFLQRVLNALAAPAGVMWGRTPEGNLRSEFQIGFNELGLDRVPHGKESHQELLRQAVQQGRPTIVPPHSGAEEGRDGPVAANRTACYLLLAPVILDTTLVGLVEVCQEPTPQPESLRNQLQFLMRMCELAGNFLRNHQLRQMTGQQNLWMQLEAFAKQIHGSLNPREVSYWVANDGLQLLQCDRVSVAIRWGSRASVEAISGSDTIEKRSRMVKGMRALFEAVLRWGERLVFTGEPDETLPPAVLAGLNTYLAESNTSAKLLILAPLRDEREKDKTRPCRSAVLIECFEPSVNAEQLKGRLDVLAKHAGPALYNAAEFGRIPLRWLWNPLATLKENLRGRPLAILTAIFYVLLLAGVALAIIPYPLRMDAEGQCRPKDGQTVFAVTVVKVVEVKARNNDDVVTGQELLIVEDLETQGKMDALQIRVNTTRQLMNELQKQMERKNLQAQERYGLIREYYSQWYDHHKAQLELQLLKDQLKTSNPKRAVVRAPIDGRIVTFDADDQLRGKTVKPGDPLLRIAQTRGTWEVILHIPEGNIGPIREALANNQGKPLKVDLLFKSHHNRTYIGWLHRDGLAGETTMVNNAVVLQARVEIPDVKLQEMGEVPVNVSVQAKVHCGHRSIGAVWFRELGEFLYEKVIF